VLSGEETLRSNSQILLSLVHLARGTIYLELTAFYWYAVFTWRPVPIIPGGPVVAQFPPTIFALYMTLIFIIRGLLTRRIWLREGKIIIYAAAVDSFEIGIVGGLLGGSLVTVGLNPGTLLLSTILVLSISSLILSLFLFLRGERIAKVPESLV